MEHVLRTVIIDYHAGDFRAWTNGRSFVSDLQMPHCAGNYASSKWAGTEANFLVVYSSFITLSLEGQILVVSVVAQVDTTMECSWSIAALALRTPQDVATVTRIQKRVCLSEIGLFFALRVP